MRFVQKHLFFVSALTLLSATAWGDEEIRVVEPDRGVIDTLQARLNRPSSSHSWMWLVACTAVGVRTNDGATRVPLDFTGMMRGIEPGVAAGELNVVGVFGPDVQSSSMPLLTHAGTRVDDQFIGIEVAGEGAARSVDLKVSFHQSPVPQYESTELFRNSGVYLVREVTPNRRQRRRIQRRTIRREFRLSGVDLTQGAAFEIPLPGTLLNRAVITCLAREVPL